MTPGRNEMRKIHHPLCFGFFIVCFLASSVIVAGKTPPPDIIFLFADDLGCGDVGIYGGRKKSPLPLINWPPRGCCSPGCTCQVQFARPVVPVSRPARRCELLRGSRGVLRDCEGNEQPDRLVPERTGQAGVVAKHAGAVSQ